jgi:hypothetical protein
MLLKKSKDECKLRYVISQHGLFTRLCSMTLFVKINFLYNQMIVEIDTHIKLIK